MKEMVTNRKIPSSFRDPSGFIFFRDSTVYRQVNAVYKENYDQLINSGLYKALVNAELLIPHQEVGLNEAKSDKAYKVIRPEVLHYISYPYEWSFSQLKHAALITLKTQRTALDYGMSLKDSSAYNIQFRKGKAIFIDTLSFGKYREGQPWVAYRQFCQHFFAPLVLMSYRDIRLNKLFRVFIDGPPLDLASALLPFSTYFRFSMLSHIHLHARSQKYYEGKTVDTDGREMSRLSFLALIDNLESAINGLKWEPRSTEWANYYEGTNYSSDAFQCKKQLVNEFLDKVNPKKIWDLGANTGRFSRLASDKGIQTISFDIDPAAVEKSYLECVEKGETNILPLVLDLTNPSPAIGWENEERMSFLERGPADAVFALALIHHLAISNNLPFGKIADFFNKICNWLIIEFVPKNDSQVQRLLATREDLFVDYKQQVFESEFSKYFKIKASVKITNSERTLYLMEKTLN